MSSLDLARDREARSKIPHFDRPISVVFRVRRRSHAEEEEAGEKSNPS